MDWLRESQWLVWLAVALGAGVAEVLSLDFVLLMFAGGALAASGTAAFGADVPVQVLTFALTSTLLLVLARPPLRRWVLHSTPETSTGTAALTGREAEALTTVTERGGQVRLAGEVWSARTPPDVPVVEPGSPVVVVRIEGATAVVQLPARDALP